MRSSDRRRLTLKSLSIGALLAGLLIGPQLARAESEMSFRAVRIGNQADVISATGQITEDTPDRFAAFLDENPTLRGRRPVVFLDSPGGRVVASIELGKLLRRVDAAAVVARVESDGAGNTVMTNAQCFSACVYALIGARKRVIPASSLIGIHRMFAYEAEVDASGTAEVIHRRYDNGNLRGYLMQYSSQMGVSPGLISAAEHIPSDNLKILSRAEIRRWHLGVAR